MNQFKHILNKLRDHIESRYEIPTYTERSYVQKKSVDKSTWVTVYIDNWNGDEKDVNIYIALVVRGRMNETGQDGGRTEADIQWIAYQIWYDLIDQTTVPGVKMEYSSNTGGYGEENTYIQELIFKTNYKTKRI